MPHSRVLIISSFPPRRCGVASYAAAQMEILRTSGLHIETLTFQEDGSTTYRFSNKNLSGLRKASQFICKTKFDRIILHFTEELVWPKASNKLYGFLVKAYQFWWMYTLLRATGSKTDVYVHEITTTLSRTSWKRKIRDALLSAGRHYIFHTEEERRAFLSCYPSVRSSRTSLVEHAENFKPKYTGSKIDARMELGLEPNSKMLLCIGFIAPHKGIEDAIESMKAAASTDLKLFIIGSLRTDSESDRRYLDKLKHLASSDMRIAIHNTYVDDRTFDMWIKASDAVLLPYKEIWSSGVGARSTVIKTPLIIRGHPNLRSQFASDNSVAFFNSNAELTAQINLLASSV